MSGKPTEGSFVAIMHLKGEKPKILLPVRADGKGPNLIGGRREKGETPEECALRETMEETGFTAELLGQIGEDLNKLNDDGEVTDIARVYRGLYLTGILRDSDESKGFIWVDLDSLPTAGLVQIPCEGFPRGRTYAMAELALKDTNGIHSWITPLGALGECKQYNGHVVDEDDDGRLVHLCAGDSMCQPPHTCSGDKNTIVLNCLRCRGLAKYWEYDPDSSDRKGRLMRDHVATGTLAMELKDA